MLRDPVTSVGEFRESALTLVVALVNYRNAFIGDVDTQFLVAGMVVGYLVLAVCHLIGFLLGEPHSPQEVLVKLVGGALLVVSGGVLLGEANGYADDRKWKGCASAASQFVAAVLFLLDAVVIVSRLRRASIFPRVTLPPLSERSSVIGFLGIVQTRSESQGKNVPRLVPEDDPKMPKGQMSRLRSRRRLLSIVEAAWFESALHSMRRRRRRFRFVRLRLASLKGSADSRAIKDSITRESDRTRSFHGGKGIIRVMNDLLRT
ncbi:unnamed protein product [Darwinula stevensoni]|uniref:Uncharacterized protein n=1 Tax=Darwinula stevensoni TaxID=69355 RepID=A0A7R9A229_9CRUS|nr:unnamed protein product [Darwinula stevensoni]CAG0878696.1 unnamed protein product [Darwinula stevensoni]